MEPVRFIARCPFDQCGHTLFPVRIQTEPLGIVVLVCFNCHYVYLSESVNEKPGYITIARLSNGRPNLRKTLAAYTDALGCMAPLLEWLRLVATDKSMTEASLHYMSTLYVFLEHMSRHMEYTRNNLENFINKPKDP